MFSSSLHVITTTTVVETKQGGKTGMEAQLTSIMIKLEHHRLSRLELLLLSDK